MFKKKILLTGAAGTIGSQVFLELMRQNDFFETRIFERKLPNEKIYRKKIKAFQKLLKPFENKIEIIWGDLTNPLDVENAVKGCDMVIHLAAVIPPLADEKPELAKMVNIGGTKNIIDAMKKFNVKRLIYPSSIAVYGDRLKNPWIKISDPINLSEGDFYGFTKIKSEEMIQKSGLEWTIFRLSAIFVSNFSLNLDSLSFALNMPLDTKVEWLSSEDCAFALVNSLSKPNLVGGIYNLGGGRKCRTTFREYVDRVIEIMGLSSDIIPEDAFAKNNFHCGFYDDNESDKIQQILQFQRNTIDDHYNQIKDSINQFKRGLVKLSTIMFKPIVRRIIIKKSEEYNRVSSSS